MTVWVDAQISPAMARWIETNFGVECRAVRDFGLAAASDREIYVAARRAGAVIMTKDRDFAELSSRLGPPPRVLLLVCGNTSNAALQELLTTEWGDAWNRLSEGDALVTVGAVPRP